MDKRMTGAIAMTWRWKYVQLWLFDYPRWSPQIPWFVHLIEKSNRMTGELLQKKEETGRKMKKMAKIMTSSNVFCARGLKSVSFWRHRRTTEKRSCQKKFLAMLPMIPTWNTKKTKAYHFHFEGTDKPRTRVVARWFFVENKKIQRFQFQGLDLPLRVLDLSLWTSNPCLVWWHCFSSWAKTVITPMTVQSQQTEINYKNVTLYPNKQNQKKNCSKTKFWIKCAK